MPWRRRDVTCSGVRARATARTRGAAACACKLFRALALASIAEVALERLSPFAARTGDAGALPAWLDREPAIADPAAALRHPAHVPPRRLWS